MERLWTSGSTVRSRVTPGLWKPLLVALYVAVNLSLTVVLVRPENVPDWAMWAAIDANPYDNARIVYVWSPLLIPVMQVIGALGPLWSIVGHVAAVLLLRSPLLIVLTLTSWAFWTDAVAGNLFTFVFVAGALALRGERWALFVSWFLFLLMPRPIVLPLLVWLLWRQRNAWWSVLILSVIYAMAVIGTGLAPDWISAALRYGGAPEYDIGPTAWFGKAWFIIGVPIAVWLTWRDRVGWAGLAMTNYLMPQYLLILLLEVRQRE